MTNLPVKLLSDNAQLPKRGSEYAAGYDLYSPLSVTIPSWSRKLIFTDLCISLPPNTYGRVAPRSGLAVRYGIDIGAGVIDEDYTGNIGVLLLNNSDEDYTINKGDRIAQLVIEPILHPTITVTKELNKTTRSTSGFGSTNK